ncbi:MAG: hypothetical protein IT327_09455 [Anaerolineae bacterium]|jgi:hypothetical protein|nr:hypothetical protein [Anaerolineae bacterium]
MDIALPPDFKEFLKLLRENEVEYLLIGGYAIGYHGYPRATNDLDVWVAIDPKNAQKIVTALQQFGFQTSDLTDELFLQEKSIVRMGVPPMRIEILTTISGVDFEESFQARIETILDGVEVNLISLSHLKQNKKASGRYKDLDDLEHLP